MSFHYVLFVISGSYGPVSSFYISLMLATSLHYYFYLSVELCLLAVLLLGQSVENDEHEHEHEKTHLVADERESAVLR